jgi:hypothetical protein
MVFMVVVPAAGMAASETYLTVSQLRYWQVRTRWCFDEPLFTLVVSQAVLEVGYFGVLRMAGYRLLPVVDVEKHLEESVSESKALSQTEGAQDG